MTKYLHIKPLKEAKKLKAFTIMEILITMIVSSIAISLIIGLYLNNQKALLQYMNISSVYSNNLDFLTLIKTDIEQSNYIIEAYSGIELHNKKQIIEYQFLESQVIRYTRTQADSFPVKIRDYEFLYLNNNSQWIEYINLSLNVDVFEKDILLSKSYTKDVLFELDFSQ